MIRDLRSSDDQLKTLTGRTLVRAQPGHLPEVLALALEGYNQTRIGKFPLNKIKLMNYLIKCLRNDDVCAFLLYDGDEPFALAMCELRAYVFTDWPHCVDIIFYVREGIHRVYTNGQLLMTAMEDWAFKEKNCKEFIYDHYASFQGDKISRTLIKSGRGYEHGGHLTLLTKEAYYGRRR